MKPIIALAVILGAAFAAPAEHRILEESLRSKKSAYGAPCGGAAPLAPVALYLAPGGQVAHYRENEHAEQHDEHARSYGGYEGAAASAVAVAAAAPSGAVGVFPNARVGGCAIPLLLSCAPNVVSGHLSHGAYAPGSYRSQEAEHKMREAHGAQMQEQGHQQQKELHQEQKEEQNPQTLMREEQGDLSAMMTQERAAHHMDFHEPIHHHHAGAEFHHNPHLQHHHHHHLDHIHH